MDTTFDTLSAIGIELSDEQLADVDGGLWPFILAGWLLGAAIASCVD